LNEPERERSIWLIEAAPVRRLSAASRVETLVIEGRKRDAGRELFLHQAAVEIVPVTLDQAEFACQAFRRYGRGRHPAGPSFGQRVGLCACQDHRRAPAVQGRRLRPNRYCERGLT
jgi:ribonuclease VapC